MVQQYFLSAMKLLWGATRVALVTSKRLAVTAEAAVSSPVVPAIPFKYLQTKPPASQGMLGDDKRRTRMAPSENAHKQHSLNQVCVGQNTRRQNGVDQFVLRQSFALRCRLHVLVRDMEVAVPQVVSDRELMFAHLCQHGSNRVPKSVPAHTRDSDSSERRPNLLLQH
jgi:hypothetical protein